MTAIGRRGLLAVLGAAVASNAFGPAAWAGSARKPAAGDLTGTWTNAWYTKLERPKAFTSLVVTPAEAEAYAAPRRAHGGELIGGADVLGQNEAEFPDNGPGLARIRGELRSSWIVDPADGKIPWRPKTEAIQGLGKPSENYDNVEARDTEERCLTNPGAGAPIINDHDANLVQFVQTGDRRAGGFLAIYGEKNHQVRIVRIAPAGGPRIAAGASPDLWAAPPGDWLGNSVGHWEGATLVVETTGLRPGITMVNRGLLLSQNSRVIERFARTGPAEISYGFEITDETLFTQTIRGEMVFRPAEGQIYEYACHEGNYSLPGILAGGRRAERDAMSAAKAAAK